MKLVIRTFVFHTICIMLFTFIYIYLSNDFNNIHDTKNKKYPTLTDFVLLSTTIQAGVGFSDLFPITFYSKIAIIIQQYIMILTHIITLYIFTL
jgi:hypothetical protein